MPKLFRNKTILILFIFLFTSQPQITHAETEQSRAALEQELKSIEAQISAFEKELATTATEKKTLTNKIKQLKTEQSNLKLQIQATTLTINKLDKELTKTQGEITLTSKKLIRLRSDIATILRFINERDQTLLLESLTQKNGLADSFIGLQNYQKLFDGLRSLMGTAKRTQAELNSKKVTYQDQQEDARELLALKGIQQGALASRLAEQASVLAETAGKEANYQKILADSRQRAAQIRGRIYELFGGATNKQINFGEAVSIASWTAGRVGGVRPAFLLAVLTQESNLGKNVGTCNRAGDPEEKGWRTIMKPERDQEPFQTITQELGLNIDTTPVSCPLKDKNGKQYGWGGAMGPAQFIPSTWMGYRAKVATVTGNATANPWDIRDAFVAAAVKLKNDGAGDGTKKGEFNAAMRYFAGSINLKYRFYGDNVAKLAESYQNDIENIK